MGVEQHSAVIMVTILRQVPLDSRPGLTTRLNTGSNV